MPPMNTLEYGITFRIVHRYQIFCETYFISSPFYSKTTILLLPFAKICNLLNPVPVSADPPGITSLVLSNDSVGGSNQNTPAPVFSCNRGGGQI